MAATDPVSEEELASALQTDPKFALELLDADYREHILQYIRQETWGRLQPRVIASKTLKKLQ